MRLVIASSLLAVVSLACLMSAAQIPTPTAPTATPTIPTPPAAATGTPSAVPTAEADTATVRAATVNVRQTPGGDVIGQLVDGTDVLVIGYDDTGDWAHIAEPDGWVFVGCLSISDRRCEAK